MIPDEFSLTQEQIAASIHGAGHIKITEDGVAPSHFTPWVTDRVMSPTFTVIASAAGGAVLRVRTSANRLRIDFTPHRVSYSSDAPPSPFVAVADAVIWEPAPIAQNLGVLFQVQPDDSVAKRDGPSGSIVLVRPPGADDPAVDVHLPIDAAVILHSVSADAPIEPRQSPSNRRWVHHGSSISQGGALDDPLLPWPVQSARALGVDVVNASLPGNCLLDPCVAEELAGLPADVVSLELGINIANWDSHIARTFVPAVHHVLDQFYRANPSRQLILISPLYCGMYEQHGGALELDEEGGLRPATPARREALTLTDIRTLLGQIVQARPRDSVILVDGRSLLGRDDQHFLSDGLHPDAAGTALIAERFIAMSTEPDGALYHLQLGPPAGSTPTKPLEKGWTRA